MHISLGHLDFVISFRAASAERKENLLAALRHLRNTYTDYTIWLLEADASPQVAWHEIDDIRVRHTFVHDTGPFPKAMLYNLGARLARSDVVCFHDADMIAPPEILKFCLDDLRSNSANTAWCPFLEIVNVQGNLRRMFSESGDYALLNSHSTVTSPLAPEMNLLYPSNAGGVVLFRRSSYFDVGGYDAAYTGWGGEDNDLRVRAARLGMPWHSASAYRLFHLHHDSAYRTNWDRQPDSEKNVRREIESRNLSQEAFEQHIETLRRSI